MQIYDFFDPSDIYEIVEQTSHLKGNINKVCGREETSSVAPLLEKIYNNAVKNMEKSKSGVRHDSTVKKFSLALFILLGKSGYEFLQKNLGSALPAVATTMRMISQKERIEEGCFYFKELSDHLKEWNACAFVHIHLDDTRIKHRVEYDALTDCFTGFVLPIDEHGIPVRDSFILDTFDDLKDALETSTVAKYAHCIVARSVQIEVPSFIVAVLGTDSKYDHKVIIQRWNFIANGLLKEGIKVVSNGADGAGPFLKAMLVETKLFSISNLSNVPKNWTFFLMPCIPEGVMYSQDCVHLLAKLRTRLLGPSNLIIIGSENASQSHLQYVYDTIDKEKHGLTQQCIDNKDKQNYGSIAILVSDEVQVCLQEVSKKLRTLGTKVYLGILMRNIRDAFFDKTISPVKRLLLMWEATFFVRIWRCWLWEQGYCESEHFITTNA